MNSTLPQAAAVQKCTADEYARTPEGPPWIQLIDGAYHVADTPLDVHQITLGRVYLGLALWAEPGDKGLVGLAPFDVYLSDYDVVQPDLLYLSKAKYGLRRNGRLYGPPDLVVEILSPSTSDIDLGPKRALYARSLVPEMWAVDPGLRQVRVFRFSEDPELPVAVLEGRQKLASTVLPRFSARVSDFFAP